MREIQIQNGNRSHLFCGRTIWMGIVVRQSPFFLLTHIWACNKAFFPLAEKFAVGTVLHWSHKYASVSHWLCMCQPSRLFR